MRMTILTGVLLSTALLGYGEELTGWLSDAKCAAAGKAAKDDHAACAKKCVEGGEAVVLVTADNKVYKIKNQEKVNTHAGAKVVLTGTVDGDSITVDKGRKAEQ